jgi:hypothetical protein
LANHDRQTVLDAALLPPSLRATIITGYEDLATENRRLGHHDIAAYCADRAAALAYGGQISLAVLVEGAL